MKRFITKQRSYLILGGIVFLIIFTGLAWRLKPSTVLGSICTNLAAGALTISLTAAVIDWLIIKETQSRNKETYELAINSLKFTRLGIEASLGEVYGFIESYRSGEIEQLKKENPDNISAAYLKEIDLQNNQIFLEYLPMLVESISKTRTTLDDTIKLHGYALPAELKSSILEYRKAINEFLQWFESKLNDEKKHLKNRLYFASTGFYESFKTFYKELEQY